MTNGGVLKLTNYISYNWWSKIVWEIVFKMVLVYLYYRKISLGILSLELSEMKQAGEKMSHEKWRNHYLWARFTHCYLTTSKVLARLGVLIKYVGSHVSSGKKWIWNSYYLKSLHFYTTKSQRFFLEETRRRSNR